MADSSSSSTSFLKGHWHGWKDFWAERFSFLDNYKMFIQDREKPIASWSESDVQEFIALDPVHGPTLKAAREGFRIAAIGSAIGAISSAGVAWKYSKSPHGALISLVGGALFGVTFGQEFAGHWLQLYRLDTMAAQVEFFNWWVSKTEGRS